LPDGDLIVALASAPGIAGVAVVRMSGEGVLEAAQRVTGERTLPHATLTYCTLRDPRTGSIIDLGYVVRFQRPRSYTGEDVVEFQVHGSPAGVDRLVDALYFVGARAARPGEFTMRALLAGKLDLAQAEALLDVLHAGGADQHAAALQHLDGATSRAIADLRAPLLRATSDIEARLDFAAEPHLAVFDPHPLRDRLVDLAQRMRALAATANAGRIRVRGARVVLAGAPNAGKSTLLNALCGADRAIVDARPGTTRDTIEVRTAPHGTAITWVDTAGLRATSDPVEAEGTRRATAELGGADIVVWVVDQAVPPDPMPPTRVAVVAVRNKADLPVHPAVACHPLLASASQVCAARGEGVSELRDRLVDHVRALASVGGDAVAICRQRHADHLVRAAAALDRAVILINIDPALELVAADLRDALDALDELTGPLTPDDVLAKVFSEFCIGK